MDNIVDDLLVKKKALEIEIKKIDQAVKTIQESCIHDYVWYGNDSHYDYLKCKKCSKVEKE